MEICCDLCGRDTWLVERAGLSLCDACIFVVEDEEEEEEWEEEED